MNRYVVPVQEVKHTEAGFQLVLNMSEQMARNLWQYKVRQVEVGIDDGRRITIAQRRKIYATLRDIAEYTGYTDEAMKEVMKAEHMLQSGCGYFSLSNCSVTTAREYINTLMEYALKEGVILQESGIQRTDDIDTYLIQCIRYHKCCVCGRAAEIHHVDAIGMGKIGVITTTARTELWHCAGSIIRFTISGGAAGSWILIRYMGLSGNGQRTGGSRG